MRSLLKKQWIRFKTRTEERGLFTHSQINVLLQLQLFVHLSVARVCLETVFDKENNCCTTCTDLCVHIIDFIFRLLSILSNKRKDCDR